MHSSGDSQHGSSWEVLAVHRHEDEQEDEKPLTVKGTLVQNNEGEEETGE